MKHLRGIDDLETTDIAAVFDTIWCYRAGQAFPKMLEGKQVCLAFFQPSTRTRVDSHTACSTSKCGPVAAPRWQH